MKYTYLITGIALFMGITSNSHAAITGKIDAKITLESGCIINGQNTSNNASNANFGTIDFSNQTTVFTSADAQVVGSSSGITIQCTAGTVPVLTFKSGAHDGSGTGSGNKAMQHTTDPTKFVRYSLFTDAGRSDLIIDGRAILLASTGTAQTVNVYGRAYGAAALIPGVYTDVVTVELAL